MTGLRWDVIDKIPDDMSIHGSDHSEDVSLPWEVWRDALGHPHAEGLGHCKTCGPGVTCLLLAFFDAVMVSVVRELDKAGALASEADKYEADLRHIRLMGFAEAAEALGIKRQRVYQLAVTHKKFPEPVAHLMATRVWLAEDIEKFGQAWDRRPGRRRLDEMKEKEKET